MKKLALVSAAAALSMMGAANAETYTAIGYTHVQDDDSVGGVTGRLGYRMENNFGIEGELTVGTNSEDVGGVKIELDQGYGLYGVGFLPLGENTDLFGRVGYVNYEVSGSIGFISASVDVSGIGFGGGIQHFFGGGNFGVRAEYTRAEGNDGGLDMFGVSGVVKF